MNLAVTGTLYRVPENIWDHLNILCTKYGEVWMKRVLEFAK